MSDDAQKADEGARQKGKMEGSDEKTGKRGDKGRGKEKARDSSRMVLKCPKGMRDFGPREMAIRNWMFGTIREVFERHGAVTIETPTLELKSILMGKYGDDSKLIYDLADQGGEELSLRFDLTVPFSRYLAQNSIQKLKRYQIGRVYRRDQSSIAQGRYREFYQCDFDYAGLAPPLLPDAECVCIIAEVLEALNLGDYTIKLSHRMVLDAVLLECGVPAEMFHPVCSSIDKLDKMPWSKVKDELVNEKKLAEEVCDKLARFVEINGEPFAVLKQLRELLSNSTNPKAPVVLAEMELFLGYVRGFRSGGGGSLDRIKFDLSLARGLEYYTGVVFEATVQGVAGMGSVAGGGRYDKLVGMFSGKDVPATGFALGVERLFRILEAREKTNKRFARETPADVWILCAGGGGDSSDPLLLGERTKLVAMLWKAKIKAELCYSTNPKLIKQMAAANRSGVPVVVILGQSEVDAGQVRIRRLLSEEQSAAAGGEAPQECVVPRESMVEEVAKILGS